MITPNDPRLNKDSEEFDYTMLAHYNEDLAENYIEESLEARRHQEEEFERGLLTDERMKITEEFIEDRLKGRIDKYELSDVLAHYGYED